MYNIIHIYINFVYTFFVHVYICINFPTAVFKFSLIEYHTFAEVPLRLILAIATAFDERREVCRQCFYGERSLSYNEGAVCGEAQHVWDNPIIVIPGEFRVDIWLHVHAFSIMAGCLYSFYMYVILYCFFLSFL